MITTQSLPDSMIGDYFSYRLDASGEHPIQWFATTPLPPGIRLNSGSGVLAGAPTAPGTFTFTINAVNWRGNDIRTFTITIAPSPHEAASFDAAMFDAAMEMSAGIAPMSAAALSTRTITYTYDTARRLVREHDTGVGSGATTRAYTFDARGNRTQMTVTGAQVYTVPLRTLTI